MNKENIKTYLDDINTLDIWALLKEAYPDQDLSNILLEWKPEIIATNLDRVKNQFYERLTRDGFEFLPANFKNAEIENAENSVYNYLNHLASVLRQKNFPEVIKALKWLASYQVAFGFWDKSKTKVHDSNTLDLQNKANELEVLQTKIASQLGEIGTLKESLQKSYEELQSFYANKQSELQSITQARQEVQTKQNEASSILVEINNYKSQADAALNNTITARDESKKTAEEGKTFLEDFNKKASSLKSELNTYIDDVLQKLAGIDEAHSHITSKRDYIDLKEKEIIKLAAQASDGSLGHTFNKRQEALGGSARVWMGATFVMTILLFVWIFVVFTCLSETRFHPQWINPLINTLKTIPAFAILVFVASQYTKERNLQEEYAFKSSIAMTLTAYADEIAREEDADRRGVIMKTMERIYKEPKITSESVSLFGIRRKQVEAIAEKTAETVNKVIDKKVS